MTIDHRSPPWCILMERGWGAWEQLYPTDGKHSTISASFSRRSRWPCRSPQRAYFLGGHIQGWEERTTKKGHAWWWGGALPLRLTIALGGTHKPCGHGRGLAKCPYYILHKPYLINGPQRGRGGGQTVKETVHVVYGCSVQRVSRSGHI